ncbi:MAG: Uma2 family endonuclease [Candidatus Kapaibacteriota bacterium]|jgi:Uma2 family endonuclease
METVISSALPASFAPETIIYPDSDGLPMANNTEHFERIATTKYGLESIFADRDDVVVAGDLFWYPVKGRPRTVLAPDVMVIFGRPKGERKSYKQWEEGGIAPQVVFEFVSESNTTSEMTNKAIFYDRYGVQEYYLYDIERKILSGFVRFQEQDESLEVIPEMSDWTSPRLGVRFDISSGELVLQKPDGTTFLSYAELENVLSETRKRLNTFAAKLRELGINPDSL